MLSQFLTSELFAFLLIFCRLGSAIMLLPGFSEAYVAPRIRLMLALMLSLILTPVIHFPPTPTAVSTLLFLMIGEILVGLFIGGIARMLIAGMHVAGTVIAYQSSLASALTLNISGFSGQDTSLGNLMSMTAVVLLFVTDLHHVMLRGLTDSYTLFVPGQFPLVGDFADHAAHTMNNVFRIGIQLAAPSIVIGLLVNLGSGIIARLMPNIQIFFIMMAPQIMLSFFILMTCISGIMLWYMDYLRESLGGFLTP